MKLELAKKMVEVGFKQTSDFYWVVEKGNTYKELSSNLFRVLNDHLEAIYPNYTVEQLGVMLPESLDLVSNPKGKSWLDISKITNFKGEVVWTVGYGNMKGAIFLFETANTEADARAKMLIYLKGNGYI